MENEDACHTYGQKYNIVVIQRNGNVPTMCSPLVKIMVATMPDVCKNICEFKCDIIQTELFYAE